MKNIVQKLSSLSLLLLFFVFSKPAVAQELREINGKTYHITDPGSVKDIQPYIDALNNSDMRNHRLRNKRYSIIFMNGLKVELFSAQEMADQGLAVTPSEYPESFDASRQEPVFALGANNFLIEYHTATGKQGSIK